MKRRLFTLILAFAVLIGCLPFTQATATGTGGPSYGGPYGLTENIGEVTTGFAAGSNALTKYESSGSIPFSENRNYTTYAAQDMVTFIVVMDEDPLLEHYTAAEIAQQTRDVLDYEQQQQATLAETQAGVAAAFGSQEGFSLGFTYTVATTGFSVTTQFGNKAQLEAMEGVKRVYVAPTFALPEDGLDQEIAPYTSNSSTMIGADVLNGSGYTGKGMRIAILDTGIDISHPSFAALPDSALDDPMTRESVAAVWDSLNASELTNMLNVSYISSKLPFVFNYDAGTFDVANTYARSDHGTHVAGIAAANRLDSTTVVGMAPEAQLVVMQVFQSGGGASWDVIMAALEDCLRLEVDTVNLSLGAAAGFSDPIDDMLQTLSLFQESDIQVLIASGNDTNNAFMNLFGLDMSLIENPDIGLAGTPSTYSAALAVGSVDNDGYEQMYITVDGQDWGYQDTALSSATSFISRFRNTTLQYVVVPGTGALEDYENLNVTGSVALVSRGTLSFMEKQANAQAMGAIACIVYNNDIGPFAMQINDGQDHIPAISITMEAGQAMIEKAGAAGVGSLTVCDADMQVFKVAQTVSAFSSWGVTPDLKLKPEISGVGGSIYSTVSPDISGSYYGYMSGTSMATPQIAGAMAVLLQYLEANFPHITGAQQRRMAANLLMSTANPVMATMELEYSPRAQGAGLADLVKATTTKAYLSNAAASESRPKVEFGDDPERTGVFTFSFQINNISSSNLVYSFDSSVFTESIYADYFIANSPYGLEAKVSFAEDYVQVPANSTVTVEATLTLTANDIAYLEQFPNGIYVEGYVYATPLTSGEAVTLTMPMVGFYGDWSDADVFDSHSLQNDAGYSLYPTVAYTYLAQLGTNPYFRGGASGDAYNAFSYANPLSEIDFGLLRNARYLKITVTNAATGEEYHLLEGEYMGKTHYNASYGMIVPTFLLADYGEVWDGKDLSGKMLPDGTTVIYSIQAWLDDGDEEMDDSFSFPVTLDTRAPEVVNADTLQSALRIDETTGRIYLTLDILENLHVAALIFISPDGAVMGKYEVANTPGQSLSNEYEITGFGNEFTIVVADYACNETEIEVLLDLGEYGNATAKPVQLDKGRLYGSETFDSAAVEPGWFSADKTDFSDYRNETFDSGNRYYAAEYVNGYLVAQSTATGHLELVTPSGTYWSTRVISQNSGSIGDPNVWLLYDMALDHSGTLVQSYGVYNHAATDGLFAVGWMYMGDTDNDGHDDGYNALFAITFNESGYVNVTEVGRIAGVGDGVDLLTLGITTDGKVYGIDTNGILYSVANTTTWDGSIGQWGAYVVECTAIGATDFVNYPGYAGANVIQSMGYDHNTGTMYWYAHSQAPNGAYYDNINVTYTVNLETGACTEVGTYGAGGLTCLFVPNDLVSDLFTMGVAATGLQIEPYSTTVVEGQRARLKINWQPWNAAAQEVTWYSDDDTIVTVDDYGVITGVSEGTTYIYAETIINVEPYWGYDSNWNWVQFPGGPTPVTSSCAVTVVASEDALYGYVVEDFGNPANNLSWFTYSDKNPYDVTFLGQQLITESDMEGNEYTTEPMWSGGTYYNGYIYSVISATWIEDDVIYNGTKLYRSKVTPGATAADTRIGQPEFIGAAEGLAISALAFDYNTGRMYCVENQYVGGLGIIDLETGKVDMLGLPNGDLSGATYMPGLCVTRDGTIVISDAVANLYTIDPDTLTTKMIYQGSGSPYTAFYEALVYDYNTDAIYWNMCDGNGASPLYMVLMPEYDGAQATVVDLGGVSTKYGTQQTILFVIPEEEPETKFLPVQSIEITNGDAITGLVGGSVKLNTVTVPARPTLQTKTWTSSDESVVTVDAYGTMTYTGIGTATITVSITNKDEATHGGPFTDSITVTVLESAGEFVAFLNLDDYATGYFDFWIRGNDYALDHTAVEDSMIAIYSLRTGTYYDGYFYGYTNKGQFLRIDVEDYANYKILGEANLDYTNYQVTAMAMDYTTGTMFGLTLPSNYSYSTWNTEQVPGYLVSIDLDTGFMTAVAELDFATPVYALACDADGQLYAAGGSFDYYATTTNLYKLNKTTGALSLYTSIENANVYTGSTYYGDAQYNAQMAYDFTNDRLYLNATADDNAYSNAYGMIMIQLGQEPVASNIGSISLDFGAGRDIKYGKAYLGLLAFLPDADQTPAGQVNGVILDTGYARVPMGKTLQLNARVRPANALDTGITWSSSDETVATVDAAGVVTGVSLGTAIITATSDETGVSTTCTVTVVALDGPQSVAYTVSAQKDALIAFNPALPGQTASVVSTLSGGSTIKGVTHGENCLYYVREENGSYYLYRYDFTTKQSTDLGGLTVFAGVDGIAYDKENGLLYTVGGFYLFQFDVSAAVAGEFSMYTNYVMDADYCTLTGVAVVDGAIYTFGNEYYNSRPQMMQYADYTLANRTVVNANVGLAFIPGATDVAYDAAAELFYITDAGNNIYSLDLAGNLQTVGLLGNGIDLHGLAIDGEGKYTITFVDGVADEVVFADAAAYLAPGASVTSGYNGTPKRTGYTFAGWVDANGNAVTAETLVAGDMTVTATWTPNTYTITLVAFNGQSDATITVTYGQAIGSQLVTPVRAGYAFTGWFLADGETQYKTDTVYMVDGDITLYATWTAAPYVITLNPNGGSLDVAPLIPVYYQQPVGQLPVPTRTGYTFLGWADANGNLYTAETIYTATGDITLYAKWQAPNYTLFLMEGDNIIDIPVTFGQPVGQLPTLFKPGYTFLGWFDANGQRYTANTIYNVEGDSVLQGYWVANTYILTLLDGENGYRMEVTFGQPIGQLPTPTKDNAIFLGWYDAAGNPYTAETIYLFPADLTLTAAWEEIPVVEPVYTITLIDGDQVTTLEVKFGEAVGAMPAPTKAGYTFIGWYDEAGNAYTAETVYALESDVTLTASWQANTYTITLVDGQTETTQTVTFGAAIGQLPAPVKEGYTFIGWYDEAGNAYTAETVYALEGDVTLTASWQANTYTITLVDGQTETTQTVTFGAAVGQLPAPVKEGYTFIGWYDEAGNAYTAETVYALESDVTLTAVFEQIPVVEPTYTITLVDGQTETTQTVTFGAAVGQLPAPTKAGYTFLGWFDEAGNAYTAETVYALESDVTLTASWQANTYTITFSDGFGNETTQTVTFDAAVGQLPVPVKEGYTFIGWFDEAGNAYTAETVYTIAGDLALRGEWSREDVPATMDATPVFLLMATMSLALCALVVLLLKKRNIQ